jgi:hypothetical protein
MSSISEITIEQRKAFAAAGEEVLRESLLKLSPSQREAFWFAVCRCYGRPYEPPAPLRMKRCAS